MNVDNTQWMLQFPTFVWGLVGAVPAAPRVEANPGMWRTWLRFLPLLAVLLLAPPPPAFAAGAPGERVSEVDLRSLNPEVTSGRTRHSAFLASSTFSSDRYGNLYVLQQLSADPNTGAAPYVVSKIDAHNHLVSATPLALDPNNGPFFPWQFAAAPDGSSFALVYQTDAQFRGGIPNAPNPRTVTVQKFDAAGQRVGDPFEMVGGIYVPTLSMNAAGEVGLAIASSAGVIYPPPGCPVPGSDAANCLFLARLNADGSVGLPATVAMSNKSFGTTGFINYQGGVAIALTDDGQFFSILGASHVVCSHFNDEGHCDEFDGSAAVRLNRFDSSAVRTSDQIINIIEPGGGVHGVAVVLDAGGTPVFSWTESETESSVHLDPRVIVINRWNGGTPGTARRYPELGLVNALPD